MDEPGQQLLALKDRLTRQRLESVARSVPRVAPSSIATERVSAWFQSTATFVLVVALLRLSVELLMAINPDDEFDDNDLLSYLAFFLPIHAAAVGVAVGLFLVWFGAAHERLVILGVKGPRARSVAATFLVPGRNVIAGSQALLELWKASTHEPARSTDGQDGAPRLWIYAWWVLASVSVLATVHMMFVAANDGELRPLITELMSGSICIAVAAIGARRFVRRIDRGQQVLESAAPAIVGERRDAR